MLLICGGVGYVLMLLRFNPAPLLLGYVLGPLMEENFRRALLISGGDMGVFLDRPVSAISLGLCGLLLLFMLFAALRAPKRIAPPP